MNALPRLLTIAEAAELLRHSVSRVRKLVRSQVLPAYRIGGRVLFRADELVAWIDAQRMKGNQVSPPRSQPAGDRIARARQMRSRALEVPR